MTEEALFSTRVHPGKPLRIRQSQLERLDLWRRVSSAEGFLGSPTERNGDDQIECHVGKENRHNHGDMGHLKTMVSATPEGFFQVLWDIIVLVWCRLQRDQCYNIL